MKYWTLIKMVKAMARVRHSPLGAFALVYFPSMQCWHGSSLILGQGSPSSFLVASCRVWWLTCPSWPRDISYVGMLIHQAHVRIYHVGLHLVQFVGGVSCSSYRDFYSVKSTSNNMREFGPNNTMHPWSIVLNQQKIYGYS